MAASSSKTDIDAALIANGLRRLVIETQSWRACQQEQERDSLFLEAAARPVEEI